MDTHDAGILVISGICVRVSVCLSVCVCPHSKSKRIELSTLDLVHKLHERTSACINPKLKGLKVKVTQLSNGYTDWYDCIAY